MDRITEAIQESAPKPIRLTARQVEVLRLIDEGYKSREVAEMLYICKRTVDFHLDNIYSILGVTNRVRALNRAHALGLLSRA